MPKIEDIVYTICQAYDWDLNYITLHRTLYKIHCDWLLEGNDSFLDVDIIATDMGPEVSGIPFYYYVNVKKSDFLPGMILSGKLGEFINQKVCDVKKLTALELRELTLGEGTICDQKYQQSFILPQDIINDSSK